MRAIGLVRTLWCRGVVRWATSVCDRPACPGGQQVYASGLFLKYASPCRQLVRPHNASTNDTQKEWQSRFDVEYRHIMMVSKLPYIAKCKGKFDSGHHQFLVMDLVSRPAVVVAPAEPWRPQSRGARRAHTGFCLISLSARPETNGFLVVALPLPCLSYRTSLLFLSASTTEAI